MHVSCAWHKRVGGLVNLRITEIVLDRCFVKRRVKPKVNAGFIAKRDLQFVCIYIYANGSGGGGSAVLFMFIATQKMHTSCNKLLNDVIISVDYRLKKLH